MGFQDPFALHFFGFCRAWLVRMLLGVVSMTRLSVSPGSFRINRDDLEDVFSVDAVNVKVGIEREDFL